MLIPSFGSPSRIPAEASGGTVVGLTWNRKYVSPGAVQRSEAPQMPIWTWRDSSFEKVVSGPPIAMLPKAIGTVAGIATIASEPRRRPAWKTPSRPSFRLRAAAVPPVSLRCRIRILAPKPSGLLSSAPCRARILRLPAILAVLCPLPVLSNRSVKRATRPPPWKEKPPATVSAPRPGEPFVAPATTGSSIARPFAVPGSMPAASTPSRRRSRTRLGSRASLASPSEMTTLAPALAGSAARKDMTRTARQARVANRLFGAPPDIRISPTDLRIASFGGGCHRPSSAPQYPPRRWRAATAEERPTIAPLVGPDDERVFTDSGIEIDRLYTEEDVAPGLQERLGAPGEPPFTRGIHDGMYRDRLWTMRQYAGFATPEDTNERYRYLIEHGSTGLSMAFDLPTQLGRDSDDPLCEGEVGRTGVPIDTIEDMRICFDQIPLDQVSTSMTINAPAAILLLLYELVGEEQGVPSEKLRGTVQNDVLKEYMARGNYIYPPEPTMRLTTDIFEYCREKVPKWNTISISGYHIREKGCSAVQEVAFTLSNAIAYVEAALRRGLKIDEFAPRLAFFFNGHNNVFQEVAKFRAVRRMWAEIVRERFGAESPSSMKIRFHTQTGGVTLQAQQPEVNIIRVALQGFAAVCGGTQSLHTNGFDEALALPTERSARIALRTQQVIAHESGAAETIDPFAGSYFIESLTDEIEARAWELMDRVEEQGGSVRALEYMQKEIEESALSYHERYRTGQDIVVGVNKYVTDQVDDVDILRVDQESEDRQLARLKSFKEARDQAGVEEGLDKLRDVARGEGNLLHPIRAALASGASIGEVWRDARRLRRVPRRGVLLGL